MFDMMKFFKQSLNNKQVYNNDFLLIIISYMFTLLMILNKNGINFSN